MTDFKEEQRNEIEALESIYPDELEVLEDDPFHMFTVFVKTEDYDEESGDGMYCKLQFTYTPEYPDEVPLMEIADSGNLDELGVEELQSLLDNEAQQNVGMVMVFTLVSSVLEWLNTRQDTIKREKEEEEQRQKKLAEEEEFKKFEGTIVTVESFLAWKTKFDSERKQVNSKKVDTGGKLTGRELFLNNQELNESDLQLLADDAIEVDESLFQNLEDLDIDDDFKDL